jgi:CTP synthase (UTP-ammonia lyase)
VAKIYGQLEVEEEFACNYELNQQFQEQLTNAGLKVTGTTEGGEARVIELIEHPFFVATAYLPQWATSEGLPHPLFTAFLNAARMTYLLNEE